MARTGWLSENEGRDYPFQTRVKPLAPGDQDLPHATIVEFAAVMGVHAQFQTGVHSVWLASIRRHDPYLVLEFQTDAPGAAAESLFFVRRPADDGEFAQEWTESLPAGEDPLAVSSSSVSSSISASSAGPFCDDPGENPDYQPCGGPGCEEPRWEGFLITGLFDAVLDQLADGDTWTFPAGLWVVEPTRIQNLSGSYVSSVNLANVDRTRVTPPEGCSASSEGVRPVYPAAVCLQGPLKLREGFNCSIRQEDATNTIVIGGAVGAGAGRPCEEIPLYPGEEVPGSPFLSGGPGCDDVIKTINGKGGAQFRLIPKSGVRVYADPDNPHGLIVDVDYHDFAICSQPDFTPSASSAA